jgi:hypothetical protein
LDWWLRSLRRRRSDVDSGLKEGNVLWVSAYLRHGFRILGSNGTNVEWRE